MLAANDAAILKMNGGQHPTNTFTGYYTTTIAAGTTRAVLYGYDQHGNQDTVTQTSSGPQWTSTYNLLGQVVSKTDPDSGTSTMAYDPDGNLTQTTDSRNATISYTYDAINRKTGEYDSDIAAQQPGASGNQIAAWIYDNTNNYNGTGGISNAIGHLTTETAYSGGQEYTTQHTNFHYPLPGGGTAIRTGTATHYTFELTDQHDTPTLYLDHTAQTPTWRQYTPYGDPRGTTTPPDNHGYLNKPTDTSTGLTTLGARQYDPTTGRFTSDDPLFEPTSPGQLNGYSYTTNNPITYSDPTGLMRMSEGGANDSTPPSTGCRTDATCTHEIAKAVAASASTAITSVSNPTLKKIMKALYRPNAQFGDGSTAAAAENELLTGQPINGAFHIQKSAENLSGLVKLLEADRKSGNTLLSVSERKVAVAEAEKLYSALNTDPSIDGLKYINSDPEALTVTRNAIAAARRTQSLAEITGSTFDVDPYSGKPVVNGMGPVRGLAALSVAADGLMIVDMALHAGDDRGLLADLNSDTCMVACWLVPPQSLQAFQYQQARQDGRCPDVNKCA